jgi:hypothetical protein
MQYPVAYATVRASLCKTTPQQKQVVRSMYIYIMLKRNTRKYFDNMYKIRAFTTTHIVTTTAV